MPLVERWAKLKEWSPLSPKDVKSYLDFCKYTVPLSRSTGKRTTDFEALENLSRIHSGDEILPQIIEARQLSKGIGYLYDTTLGVDGKLHPTFTDTPKTGRLACKKPNLMNLPQGRRGEVTQEVASAIRGSFIPSREGWELGELDWKGIEAMLVGWFAEDEEYMRLARLGVHGALCAVKLGEKFDLGWDDEKLSSIFSKLKKAHPILYHHCKIVVHGSNYLMGIFLLSRELKMSIREAREFRNIYFSMAPKVKAWQDQVLREAHFQGYLINPFGYSLPFFDVFTFRNNKTYAGKEAAEAVAFKPQSTAAMMLRSTIVAISELAVGEMFFLIPTHDSILVEYPISRREEVMGCLWKMMSRPWPELGGLSIGVEAKVGPRLSSMKEWVLTS